MLIPTLFLFILSLHDVVSWDSEQLEVFDVVEEVNNENFYEMMNISQDASTKDIKTAFRTLSLKLHPDKNPGVDTSVQFRNLVSVYDILRSPTKRKYYDEVLVNGLPNWRSAVYYYRHVRKMGLVETCIILTLIISAGQYLVGWASYVEQKYTFEQLVKRKRKDKDQQKYEFDLPKPSLLNILPIQIPKLLWRMIVELPHALTQLKTIAAKRIDEAVQSPPPEIEPVVISRPPRTAKKRKPGFIPPEGPNFETTSNKPDNSQPSAPPVSGGLWTDDDLTELVELVKKFPGGIPKRWEHIAEALGRSVAEVTYMANKMKTSNFKIASEEEEPAEQPKVKQKTRVKIEEKEEESVKKWNQTQQKALEEALIKFPKGCADRWDRIAECVGDKTKEDCMIRYRYLAEVVRQQKDPMQTEMM